MAVLPPNQLVFTVGINAIVYFTPAIMSCSLFVEIQEKRIKIMIANSGEMHKSGTMLKMIRGLVLALFFTLLLYDKVPIICNSSTEYKIIYVIPRLMSTKC